MPALGFDPKQLPPDDFDVLPAADYVAAIVDSKEKETSSGDGSTYIELTWEIVEGDKNGRKLWSRHNNRNIKSPKAEQIGRRELTKIMQACNRMDALQTAELHNIPITITVKCQHSDYSGGMENVIKKYSRKTAAVSATPSAGSPAPWNRSA